MLAGIIVASSNQDERNYSANLYLPKLSTFCCQKSIRFQEVKIWNSLRIEMRKQSFKNFEDNIKNKLLESC